MFFVLSKSLSFLEQPLNWAFTLIMLATLLTYARRVALARRLYVASAVIILLIGIVALPYFARNVRRSRSGRLFSAGESFPTLQWQRLAIPLQDHMPGRRPFHQAFQPPAKSQKSAERILRRTGGHLRRWS